MPSLLRIARSARRLGGRERAQALRALGWLFAVRLALALAGYEAVRDAVRRLGPRRSTGTAMTASECGRAFSRACRVLPRTSCLARSLAAESVLRRDGLPAALTLGVRFDEGRQLRAHAWVDSGSTLVTPAADEGTYAPLGPPAPRP